MSWFWTILTIAAPVFALGCVVTILHRRKEPVSMMAWILAVILMPVIGPILYLLIGDNRVRRQARKRQRRRAAIESSLSRQVGPLESMRAPHGPEEFDDRLRDVVRLATEVGDTPPIRGNAVSVFHDAEKTYLALSLAIEAAQDHVHVQYYIFQPDETGRAFRDLLIRKASQGVRCRVLLDAVGSWALTRAFLHAFRAGGVEVAFFQPIRLNARLLRAHCRNHRKLVVIDGRVGFTGSQNIGDEYRGRLARLSPWRDTHMQMRGPVVTHMQEIFVEDWYFATQRDLSEEDHLFPQVEAEGDSIVQVFASGPDRPAGSMQMVLCTAIAAARRSIRIITPYFVPDSAMMLALSAAARRGVNVQLLLPAKSDNPFVMWAGQSFYDELLASGVEIHEHVSGMLHSKEVVIDDAWALVGSANMDIRSFRINFELTTLLYDAELARSLSRAFAGLLERARRIDPEADRNLGFGKSILLGVARLASPVL